MKHFNLQSDIIFSAENIEDSFHKIANHFINLANSNDSSLIEFGSVNIEPVIFDGKNWVPVTKS